METNTASRLPLNRSCQKVDLVSEMYSHVQIDGVNIVLAALSPKSCVSIFGLKDHSVINKDNQRCSSSCDRVLEALNGLIETSERVKLFFNSSSTAVCSRIRVDGDKLELCNLKLLNIQKSLIPVYRSLENTQGYADGFVLFGFYELPQ